MELAGGRKGSNVITVRPVPQWLPILRSARVDLPAYDGVRCSEAAGPLVEALQRVEGDPGAYRALAPSGDKGSADFDSVVQLLRWVTERCTNRPAATLRVQIRAARGPR